MKLTNNFSLEELVYSETAKVNNIENSFTVDVVNNLYRLCVNILQPVRDNFKVPVIVSSGYRSKALNKLVGGVSNSQHLTGEAVDIVVTGAKLRDVYNYIKHNLKYDQLLFESSNGNSWIHVSLTYKNNRQQAIDNFLA